MRTLLLDVSPIHFSCMNVLCHYRSSAELQSGFGLVDIYTGGRKKGSKTKRRIIGEEEERDRVREKSEKTKEVCELKREKKE